MGRKDLIMLDPEIVYPGNRTRPPVVFGVENPATPARPACGEGANRGGFFEFLGAVKRASAETGEGRAAPTIRPGSRARRGAW